MLKTHGSRCTDQKSRQISFWKYFFLHVLAHVCFCTILKKYFQKFIWFSFCPLHLDLYICKKYCNYVSNFFHLEELNGVNLTIKEHFKNILLKEKPRLAVLLDVEDMKFHSFSLKISLWILYMPKLPSFWGINKLRRFTPFIPQIRQDSEGQSIWIKIKILQN